MTDYTWALWAAWATMGDTMSVRQKNRTWLPRAHRPLRFMNPATPTAYLSPRQGMRVFMSGPFGYHKNVSQDAHYQISFTSDYFELASEAKDNKGHAVFTIAQKHDLSAWADIGSVGLGDIRLKIANNTHPNAAKCDFKDVCIRGHLLANPDRPSGANVVTVVNPSSSVKVSPHEDLEVVCYALWPEGHLDEWNYSIDDISVDGRSIQLEFVRNYWCCPSEVEIPRQGGYAILARSPFFNGDLLPKREHHFFFRFKKSSLANIRSMKDGHYPISLITLRGTCPGVSGAVSAYCLPVHLGIHAKTDGRVTQMTTVTEITGSRARLALPPPSREALLRRSEDKEKGVVCNPGQTENLDFMLPGSKNRIVEISSPHDHWPFEPNTAVWEVTLDSTLENVIKISRINDIPRNGMVMQRFLVERLSESTTECFLGTFQFSYAPKSNDPNATRRISCWTKKESVARAIPKTYRPGNETRTAPSRYNSTVYASTGHYKDGLGYYNGVARPSKVKIREVLGSLVHGTGGRKMGESYSTPICPWPALEEMLPGDEHGLKKGGTTPGDAVGAPSRKKSPTSSTATVTEVLDLVNNQELVLSDVNQELAIWLSPPADSCEKDDERKACRNEMWSVSAVTVGGLRPIIDSQKVLDVAHGRYRQKIVVRAPPNLPTGENLSFGVLKIECSVMTKLVRLRVVHSEGKDWSPPQNIKFLETPRTHEAGGELNRIVSGWPDQAGVLLQPKHVVFVNHPDVDKSWQPNNWSVRFVQHPIPLDVWCKLTGGVKSVVNRLCPWYGEGNPFRLRRAVGIKSLLATRSEMLNSLLKELALITRAPYFPTGTLHYENHAMFSSASEQGIIRTNLVLTRELHLYVELPDAKPKKGEEFSRSQVMWPMDGHTYSCRVGESIGLHMTNLSARMNGGNLGMDSWVCSSFPGNILKHNGTFAKATTTLFSFKVQEAGSGTVIFKCRDQTSRVTVSAQ